MPYQALFGCTHAHVVDEEAIKQIHIGIAEVGKVGVAVDGGALEVDLLKACEETRLAKFAAPK